MYNMTSFGIVLFNPEIPPNTGNIMRLCSNTGFSLHIIKPMGFDISDKSLKRAGMDYLKNVKTSIYDNISEFLILDLFERYFLVSKYGEINYSQIKFKKNDCFVFGSESSGLPEKIIKKFMNSKKIFIPMIKGSRSLNLANAVSIITYEALRQNKFQFL